MHSLFSDKASRHPQRQTLRTCPVEEARLVSDRAPLKVREDDLGAWLPLVRSDGQRFGVRRLDVREHIEEGERRERLARVSNGPSFPGSAILAAVL
jgi:hypothetical protein